MLQIQGFVFNFASENTYIIYNEIKMHGSSIRET